MRKTLSILVSFLMIASLFAIGVNAAEGTAINTADEFMAMAADGTYYLNADITITATFDPTFTGTLDGNGHTVTVSTPMFKQMDGTVKNLTTIGEITSSEKVFLGAVARQAQGTLENITNKADITSTYAFANKDALCVGGIVGKNQNGKAATFVKCANYGAISGPEATGGILGESQNADISFTDCYNAGDITSTFNVSGVAAGGIIGYSGTGCSILKNCVNDGNITSGYRAGGIQGDARKSANVDSCVNNGTVKGDNIAAGIVGYSGDKDIAVGLTIKNSINNGDVTGTGGGTGGAAGIAGYAWAKDDDAVKSTTIENCVNNGNIHLVNKGFASEFVAYSNSMNNKFINLIGTGKVDATGDDPTAMHLVFIGLSSSDSTKYTVQNVFMADGSNLTHYSWSATEGTTSIIEFSAIDGKDLSDTAKAITRGTVAEIVEKANAAIGAKTFAVKDGKVVFADASTEPTTPPTTEPEVPATEPTTPPTTEPEAPATEPTAPSTGDNAIVIVAAVAMVSILGVCLIGKKKVTE